MVIFHKILFYVYYYKKCKNRNTDLTKFKFFKFILLSYIHVVILGDREDIPGMSSSSNGLIKAQNRH